MKKNKIEKEYYGWADYEKDIKKLGRKIKASGKEIDSIYAVPRGGLIAGVSLSHLLETPLYLEVKSITDKTLIVDDIVDTGGTLVKLLPKINAKNPFVCSLFYNPEAEFKPSLYIRKKRKWVVFPWETKKTSKYDNTV